MITPRTPTRPRAVDLSATLTKSDKPTATFLSATTNSPARPHLLSPGTVHSLAKAAPTAPSAPTGRFRATAPPGEGWALSPDGCIVAVHAPTHVTKLSPYCSWLHQFEHARYLHAGVPQGAISWPSYPYRIQDGAEHPHLELMHDYLAALPSTIPVRRPDPSLWTEIPYCESKAELDAAFRQGSVHFSGSLVADKDRVLFKLSPPAAGMGSALYRRFGSDRFFRITFDKDLERRVGDGGASSSAVDPFRERVRTFFAHPLVVFGRQFRPFCHKDGAIVYWCESGAGIETIPLVDFAQRYLQVELNGSMSVAKYAARFELGLTTTTPTVTFRRDQVLRTPDLNTESLKVSLGAMRAVCDDFRRRRPKEARELLPGSYLPSCIRGSVQQHPGGPLVDMVWRLDYSTIPPSRPTPTPLSSPSTAATPTIQLRPFATEPSNPTRPLLRFSLETKDGAKIRILAPDGLKVDWVDDGRTARSGAYEEVVMTDGCSLMSLAAMRELSSKYAASRRDLELQPAVPCLAQGRVGLGKGVWAADHHSPWTSEHWIEIRDSQWKAKDGQSRSFTFELHSIPSAKGGSKLGKQMFEILAHCGVPTSAFRNMLRSQVELCQDAFWNSPSPAALLYHVEKTCGVLEDRTIKARMASDPRSIKPIVGSDSLDEDEAVVVKQQQQQGDTGDFCHDGRLDPSSAAPNVVAEVVVEMLQAGFDPRDDPHLAAKLHKVAEGCVKKQIGFRIQDDWSRAAFVIADHLGVLEKGEFHYQVSEPLPAPNGLGQVRNVLGPTLLTRSPAIQPCDVQLATGVFRPEYASFFDAIIVSSKGERSLCSILSGGDYDGDKLTVITNPDLVSSFIPARADPAFADPPFADSDWFTVDRRRVGDVVEPLIKAGDNGALASIFLEGFHLGTKYGMLSELHTTLAYSLGLDHAHTREVGHLFCKALDGRKQGLSFSAEQWRAVTNKFAPPLLRQHKPKWTFCDDGKEAPVGSYAKRGRGLGLHPMDEIVEEGRRLVKELGAQWYVWAGAHKFQLDEDLAVEWRRAWSTALHEREAVAPARSAYFEDLCAIRDHVRAIFPEYELMFQMWQRDAALRKNADSFTGAHGSPSKSPSKRGKAWSGSSRSQKDDLRELSGKFWAIVSEGGAEFRSRELQGEVGRRTARALLASCAYLDPLEPILDPPAVGHQPLLSRLQDCALAPSRSLSAIVTKPVQTASSVVIAPAEIVVTTPASEDEDMGDDSFDDDGDISWSQVPADLTQTALTSLDKLSSSASSQTVATTAVPPSNPSAAPISPSTAHVVAVTARVKHCGSSFDKIAGKSSFRFCFDMAHRDMLGLKADSLARRLHGGHAGASGIQASKIAPHMLDVLQVSKRCAGITSSRARVRPRTLLAAADELEVLGSPSKRARRS